MTHWSFEQLAGLAAAPPAYLRTLPARQFIVLGDRRNFELLRAIGSPKVLGRVRDLVLRAYEQVTQDAVQVVS